MFCGILVERHASFDQVIKQRYKNISYLKTKEKLLSESWVFANSVLCIQVLKTVCKNKLQTQVLKFLGVVFFSSLNTNKSLCD